MLDNTLSSICPALMSQARAILGGWQVLPCLLYGVDRGSSASNLNERATETGPLGVSSEIWWARAPQSVTVPWRPLQGTSGRKLREIFNTLTTKKEMGHLMRQGGSYWGGSEEGSPSMWSPPQRCLLYRRSLQQEGEGSISAVRCLLGACGRCCGGRNDQAHSF